jgi:sugar-specific transcriptional regulator TrmB
MKKTTNKAIVKNLMEFGLGEKEAQVYLTLLELEIATVSELAEASNVNRSSAYVVLESLKKKGLVSISEDKNVQSTPDMLLFEARNKAQKAEDIKNNIGDIVPELKALHKDTKQKPKIRVFEGKQGLINAFEDTLSSKEKVIRISSSVEKIFTVLPDYFPDYVERRIKLGIKMYGIHPDDNMVQDIIKMIPKFDKPILIPQKKYTFAVDMAIYDNKIGYMSLDKPLSAIIIEDKRIADAMKSIFDLAYQEAKRITNINKHLQKYKKSLQKFTNSGTS